MRLSVLNEKISAQSQKVLCLIYDTETIQTLAPGIQRTTAVVTLPSYIRVITEILVDFMGPWSKSVHQDLVLDVLRARVVLNDNKKTCAYGLAHHWDLQSLHSKQI